MEQRIQQILPVYVASVMLVLNVTSYVIIMELVPLKVLFSMLLTIVSNRESNGIILFHLKTKLII